MPNEPEQTPVPLGTLPVGAKFVIGCSPSMWKVEVQQGIVSLVTWTDGTGWPSYLKADRMVYPVPVSTKEEES